MTFFDNATALVLSTDNYKWVITQQDIANMNREEIRDFTLFLILLESTASSDDMCNIEGIGQRLEDLALRMIPKRLRSGVEKGEE